MDEKTDDLDRPRRATVHDVARQAGVSLATVDRVLNGRAGVRPQTAERVEKAIAVLDFRRDLSASLLARARDLRILFLIPGGANEFMAHLGDAIGLRSRQAAGERVYLETRRLPALDAAALAAALDGLDPARCDCAVVVAIEDERVRAAIGAAARRGIAILTLVSDLPGSPRRLFVGIDNGAAGRTAASLMGRFCPSRGRIAVLAGSLGLRDHRERLDGFLAVLGAEFPDIAVLGPFETQDDRRETRRVAEGLLRQAGEIDGLYNLGAGNDGLLAALRDAGRKGPRVIAHELTASTRQGLAEGVFDVVLDQNPEGEIRAAIAAAQALALEPDRVLAGETIEIGIFLRDNLR